MTAQEIKSKIEILQKALNTGIIDKEESEDFKEGIEKLKNKLAELEKEPKEISLNTALDFLEAFNKSISEK
jgi:hypothetical protein